MTLVKTAKNATIYTVALIIQKIISFVYFSYLAIALGPEKLGVYSYALSILATMVIFTDLGINNVITREVAADNNNAQPLIKIANKSKAILSLITLLGLAVFCFMVEPDNFIRFIIIFAAISMIGDTFGNAYFASLRGLQKLSAESAMAIISPLISAIVGIIVVLTSGDLPLLALSLAIGSYLSLFFAHRAFRKITTKNNKIFNYKDLTKLVGPFALASVSNKIYGYADTILMRFLSSTIQIGFYGLAYKAAFALQFIPMAAMAGVYPAMSQACATNQSDRLYYLLSTSLKYVLALGMPLAAVAYVFGGEIINYIYGEKYNNAVQPLILLFLSLPLLFSTFPLGAWLNATRKQAANTRNLVIVTIVSLFLNIIFISRYGALGAASVSLFCTSLLFCLHGFVVFKNYKNKFNKHLFYKIIKIILIGAIPLACGLILKQLRINLLLSLIIVLLSYLISLTISKIYPKEIGEHWPFLRLLCQK
jgi:O-antigen/teichoic acid export membrane protein